MLKKLKNITSILLLLVFLLPSVLKLEHHHERFVCKAKDEKHIHATEALCMVCNFEFSVFDSYLTNLSYTSSLFVDKYLNTYFPEHYSIFPKFTFLLRAPPFGHI